MESSTPTGEADSISSTETPPENLTPISSPQDSETVLKMRAYLANPLIAGFAGGIAVAVILALIALFLPFQDADNFQVLLIPTILLGVNSSRNYFSTRESGWRGWLKLAGISIICALIGTILFIVVNSGRVPQKLIDDWNRTNIYDYNYAMRVMSLYIVIEIPLLLIFAYPVSSRNWRPFVGIGKMLVFVPWKFFRFFFGGKRTFGHTDEELSVIKDKRGY